MIRAARGESPAGFDRRCIPTVCASRRPARPCPGYIQITWGCTLVALWLLMAPGGLVAQAGGAQSTQPMDADFATRVREWTTRPEFVSPLVDHLPVADGIPSPKDVLGHHAGAPRELTYHAELLEYYRALAAASPRVSIMSAGRTDEDREMVVVAIASEATIRD
ncbi:MAG: hypothetical protein VX975_05410, partial [Acidobacteriota bacterium]|nr:hypothetical protein [Acidobacteriota bacterium]